MVDFHDYHIKLQGDTLRVPTCFLMGMIHGVEWGKECEGAGFARDALEVSLTLYLTIA